MLYNEFTNIEQTDENRWQARYNGNYGVYTVKVKLDADGHCDSFSCTCPSDASPCKHIGYLQTEIKKKLAAKPQIKPAPEEVSLADILQHVSLEELRAFVIKKAKFDKGLFKAITVEFSGKLKKQIGEKRVENIYKQLVERDLREVELNHSDGDYYEYEEEELNLSVLDEWLAKAESFRDEQKFEEALLACKAVIEESSEWHASVADEEYDYSVTAWQKKYFALLEEMSENGQIDKCPLYQYGKEESQKEIYAEETRELFYDLMSKVATAEDLPEFVALQYDLLEKIEDKSSSAASKILERLYRTYLANEKQNEADELIEKNVQIETFCRLVVQKRIGDGRFTEAKQLISDFRREHPNPYNEQWNKYLLDIAQKEGDILGIRRIAFEFIKREFEADYYRIYKSTFSEAEWKNAFEELYAHYEKKEGVWYFSRQNTLDLLVMEGLTERLIATLEKHLLPEILESYYEHFAEKYPEKALQMWQTAVDSYAEKNVGGSYYERICDWLKLIRKINGGAKVFQQMRENYRILYKRRPSMMKMLNDL